MHEVVIQIKEKVDCTSKSDKDGDMLVVGWKYLDKAQKKRVLDELMREYELQVK